MPIKPAAASLVDALRRLGDETEKARKTVTARIRHTIGRIARVHPELGGHLEASSRTGMQCSYQPSGPIGWQLKFPFDLVDIEHD